tara:strand:+ start:291 stop:680 length:390 start_codon:yes stop_codon:yes gene_type:complete
MKTREQFCEKHGNTAHYIQVRKVSNPSCKRESKGTGRCKKCNVERISKHRRQRKAELVEYAGGKCVCCGYNESDAALQFHHKNPKEKDFGVAAKGCCMSLEKAKKEVDKCALVCANCHAEIHAGLRCIP